ncbi:hypothetical protein CEXT_611801 [Caerostris extrusa]|uniref:Uncharacterized protein n=1 Tax=Caerostris extrusa TaxID=172846 RepID=A0AAV4U168_CAEEX|nr:hypothetical protein CEXT_611801 [Caerostris extrusa]
MPVLPLGRGVTGGGGGKGSNAFLKYQKLIYDCLIMGNQRYDCDMFAEKCNGIQCSYKLRYSTWGHWVEGGKPLPPGLVTECLCEGVKFNWNGRSEMRPGNSAPLRFSINYNEIIPGNLRSEDGISGYERSLQPPLKECQFCHSGGAKGGGGMKSNAF